MLEREKMMNAIQDVIEEASYNWKCDGIQTEHVSELELVELKLDDPDAVINNILGIISDYIEEML